MLRKFRELENHEPRSHPILAWIRQLYEIDRKIDGPFPGDDEACRNRLALRHEHSKPLIRRCGTGPSSRVACAPMTSETPWLTDVNLARVADVKLARL